MEEEVCHCDAWYTGHVQGVGFRYKTRQLAKGFDVNGTVSNLPDGRVHLRVEGETAECDRFLAEIHSCMEHFIRHAEVKKTHAPRRYQGFHIT